jgi:hypothetical protein
MNARFHANEYNGRAVLPRLMKTLLTESGQNKAECLEYYKDTIPQCWPSELHFVLRPVNAQVDHIV